MGDDNNSAPLSRRVPGAARAAAPSASVRPALPAELLERMRAAVEAAHNEAEGEAAPPPAEATTPPELTARRAHSARPQPPAHSSQRSPAVGNGQKPQGRATQLPRPPVQPAGESDAQPPTEQLPRLNGAARGGLAGPALGDSGEQADRTTRADRVKADRARGRAAKAERARAERVAKADRAKADRGSAQAIKVDHANAARAQAERERAAQAERDRVARAERERAAQAERDRVARAERERAAQAERGRAAQAPTSQGPAAVTRAPADKRPQQRKALRRWRYRTAGLVTAAVLVLVGGGLTLALSLHSAAPRSADHGRTPAERAQAALRAMAAQWVYQQVTPGATIACDPAMCQALTAAGVSNSDLRTLGQISPTPTSSDVVIETALIRQQFGTSFATLYAPQVIASFGSGTARIDIRVIAPHGAAAYLTAVNGGLSGRKNLGVALLGSSQIVISATARKQLAAGQVDGRLENLMIYLGGSGQQPIAIEDFSTYDPGAGASPGMPLRFVDLAETDPSRKAHLSSAQYAQSIMSLLRRGTDHPLHVAPVRLPDGQVVLQIEFGAPSPIGS